MTKSDISPQIDLASHLQAHPTDRSTDRFAFEAAARWLVRRHEGVTKHPYTDSVGKITIGVGRNLSDRGLKMEEVEMLFSTDCDLSEVILDAWWPAWQDAPIGVQMGLFSMAFNLGLLRLGSFKKCEKR